jgi:hypothetical protein
LDLDLILRLDVCQMPAFLGDCVVSILARAREACHKLWIFVKPVIHRSPCRIAWLSAPFPKRLSF